MSEAHIRDLLAKDLSVLEPGLELLDVEKYIPSKLGTKSYLDLVAKDRAGHWVIIEVKKTSAASREAAHEVFKYVEAVQRHLGARNEEIRAVVASVEWKELLIPFSRLKAETTISVEGYKIELMPDGQSLRAHRVETVPINQGRYLSPWHELNLYHDHANLLRGVADYDRCCQEKGIEDYVLVVLKAADDFNEKAAIALENALREVRQLLEIENLSDGAAGISIPSERFEYILYFAPQILSREFCLKLISSNPEVLEEVEAFTADMSAEAELCTLHTNVFDMDPTPFRDHFDIGYPAKFRTTLLVDEEWSVEKVLRRGMFARNDLLTDQGIIAELSGETGSSGRSLKRTVNMANPAHVASARTDLSTALSTNRAWLAQINRVLDDVLHDMPKANVDITVFCPSSGLFTIYFIATDTNSMDHIPFYEFTVKDESDIVLRRYCGLLAPNGEPRNLEEILERYYDGRMGRMMFLASAGFYEVNDSDVLDDAGLIYRTYRVDESANGKKWFELRDDRWREFQPQIPFQPLQSYFEENSSFINTIVNEIGARMHGGFHDMS